MCRVRLPNTIYSFVDSSCFTLVKKSPLLWIYHYNSYHLHWQVVLHTTIPSLSSSLSDQHLLNRRRRQGWQRKNFPSSSYNHIHLNKTCYFHENPSESQEEYLECCKRNGEPDSAFPPSPISSCCEQDIHSEQQKESGSGDVAARRLSFAFFASNCNSSSKTIHNTNSSPRLTGMQQQRWQDIRTERRGQARTTGNAKALIASQSAL